MNLKKILTTGFILLFSATSVSFAESDTENALKAGISSYKKSDYLGCLQNMTTVLTDDPSNALAYYYAGMAQVQLGNVDKAMILYNKVITLNTNDKLTKLAKKGIEIAGTDEAMYTTDYKGPIKRSVDYLYGNGKYITEPIEEDIRILDLEIKRQKFNDDVQQELKKENNVSSEDAQKKKINNDPSAPTDKEIADAVRVLSQIGLNPLNFANGMPAYGQQAQDYAQMQMLMGMSSNNNSSDMTMMLPYLMNLQKNQNGKNTNPEFLQTFMMNNMMSDINSSFFTDDSNDN